MRILLLMLMSMGILSFGAISNAALASDEAPAEGEPSVLFVELNPLILPIINEHGNTQVVSLVVAIEVDSQEKADKVTKFQPRLTDAYLSDLYGALSSKQTEDGVIPIAYLKERLNIMSTKILGEHVVSDVLVQVMQKRPA